jgi:uncharacterized protein
MTSFQQGEPFMESGKKHPNLLIHEKSPYLLQHAYNPVDWYPWGDEAFEKAYREDKLIFLSVGYSTCHWCHVMAHESFEDEEVARLLNDVFVCVKVDREERPDIDKIYMTACQMLTGSGGWPLTIIMTHERQPVYAATYIPGESRTGMIGMVDLIPRLQEVWKRKREEVLKSAGQVVAMIRQAEGESHRETLSKEILHDAFKDLQERYDEVHGGFGPAPKFPMPHQLMFLLRYATWNSEKKALEMVEKTLQAMAKGGIYDHLGFGFHRYSTDKMWLAPHFEKMLYDQALLSMAYTEAYQATGCHGYREKACEIFNYIIRDMTSEAGGFYSAEDADSEGEEGKFYLWRRDDIKQALEPTEAEWFINIYQIEKEGNFIDQMTGRKTGDNILHLKKPVSELALSLEISEEALKHSLALVRQKLYGVREKRIHPHKDDKILTDWNGLMIAALAKGARIFEDKACLKAAQQAADFIMQNMGKPDGSLLHRYRDGEAVIAANLDDYAFFIWGLIELYETTFDVKYLQTALDLTAYVTEHFRDAERGGYYFSPDNGENLIIRQKESYDGAIPSGNSVSMLNLIRLARMTGNHDMEEQAMRMSRTFARSVRQSPAGHSQFMSAFGFLENPSYEIVITGKHGAEDTETMLTELNRLFLPNAVVIFRPEGESSADITCIAPFTKDMTSIDGKATAYICTNFACRSPITDIRDFRKIFQKKI